jgi:Cof subfamily protein (haloacid dehalogenase superfamily)
VSERKLAEPMPIRLVISDVDGTLIDHSKQLTDATLAAVKRLHEVGLHFTISSARPAAGLRDFISALSITSPVSSFNGALIVLPDLTPIRSIPLQPEDVFASAETVKQFGLDLWIYSARGWFVSRLDGPHVAHESSVTGIEPQQLVSLEVCTDGALKIVGVSDDHSAVVACEAHLQRQSGLHISAIRSQDYYLDITNMNANKGNAILEFSDVLGIPTSEIVTIGDMPTDVLMFRNSGTSIAMGNATEQVKAEATFVTRSNREEGFAYAMSKFVLREESQVA